MSAAPRSLRSTASSARLITERTPRCRAWLRRPIDRPAGLGCAAQPRARRGQHGWLRALLRWAVCLTAYFRSRIDSGTFGLLPSAAVLEQVLPHDLDSVFVLVCGRPPFTAALAGPKNKDYSQGPVESDVQLLQTAHPRNCTRRKRLLRLYHPVRHCLRTDLRCARLLSWDRRRVLSGTQALTHLGTALLQGLLKARGFTSA